MGSYLTLQSPTVRYPAVGQPQLVLVCNQDTEPEVLRNYLGAIWYMISGRSVVDQFEVRQKDGRTQVVLTLIEQCIQDDAAWYRSFVAVQDIIAHTNLLVGQLPSPTH